LCGGLGGGGGGTGRCAPAAVFGVAALADADALAATTAGSAAVTAMDADIEGTARVVSTGGAVLSAEGVAAALDASPLRSARYPIGAPTIAIAIAAKTARGTALRVGGGVS
jgi:hypothetical protein